MSWVANVILCFDVDDDRPEIIEGIESFFNSNDYNYPPPKKLNDFPEAYGGSKHLETIVMIGAFNYLCRNRFLDHLHSLSWRAREDVQCFIKDQDDDIFTEQFQRHNND